MVHQLARSASAAPTVRPATGRRDRHSSAWRVVVSGTGDLRTHLADALLSQTDVGVRVSLVGPLSIRLRPVNDAGGSCPAPLDAVVGRILADPRAEVHDVEAVGPAAPEADAVFLAAMPGAPAAPLRGWLSAREICGLLGGGTRLVPDVDRLPILATARSAVVIGSAPAAVALARQAALGTAGGGPVASLRDIHLVLSRSELSAAATVTALRELVGLDVEVMADTSVVPRRPSPPSLSDRRLSACLELLDQMGEHFASMSAPRLHLHFGGELVEVLGVDEVAALVFATPSCEGQEPELVTLTTDLVVDGGRRQWAAEGVGTAGEYVAFSRGDPARDEQAARRAVQSFVEDVMSGRLAQPSATCGEPEQPEYDGVLGGELLPFRRSSAGDVGARRRLRPTRA